MQFRCGFVVVPVNCNCVVISPLFAIFKSVVHSLEPGETPRYSASHRSSNYATFLNIAKYYKTVRCGCGFFFNLLYFNLPVQYSTHYEDREVGEMVTLADNLAAASSEHASVRPPIAGILVRRIVPVAANGVVRYLKSYTQSSTKNRITASSDVCNHTE